MAEIREDYVINIIGRVNINAQDIQRQVNAILSNVQFAIPINLNVTGLPDIQQQIQQARNIQQLGLFNVVPPIDVTRQISEIPTEELREYVNAVERASGASQDLVDSYIKQIKITSQATVETSKFAETGELLQKTLKETAEVGDQVIETTKEIALSQTRLNKEILESRRLQEEYTKKFSKLNAMIEAGVDRDKVYLEQRKLLIDKSQSIIGLTDQESNRLSELNNYFSAGEVALRKYNKEMTGLNNLKAALPTSMRENLSLLQKEKRILQDLARVTPLTEEQTKRLQELSLATRDTGGSIDYLRRNIAHVIPKIALWAVGTTAVYGSLRALKGLMNIMIDFQTGLLQIKKIMPDDVDLRPLEDFALKAAPVFGKSLAEVTEVMADFARVTKDVNEIIKFTKLSLLLTGVTGLESARATEVMIALSKQYGLTIGQLMTVIDQFNYLTNTQIVRQDELAEAILRSSGAARLAGFTVTDLMVMIAVLREVTGLAASKIGIDIRNISIGLELLEDAVKEVVKEYPSLVPPKDFTGTAVQQLAFFAKKLNELPLEERSRAIVKFALAISGARKSIAGVIPLFETLTEKVVENGVEMTRMERIMNLIAKTSEATGSAINELSVLMGGQAFFAAQLRAQWQVLGAELGRTGILNSISAVTLSLMTLVVKMAEFVNRNAEFISSVLRWSGIIGVFGALYGICVAVTKILAFLIKQFLALLAVNFAGISAGLGKFAAGLTAVQVVALKTYGVLAILLAVILAIDYAMRRWALGGQEDLRRVDNELKILDQRIKKAELGRTITGKFERPTIKPKIAPDLKKEFEEADKVDLESLKRRRARLVEARKDIVSNFSIVTKTISGFFKDVSKMGEKALGEMFADIKPEPLDVAEVQKRALGELDKVKDKAVSEVIKAYVPSELIKRFFELRKELKSLREEINALDVAEINMQNTTRILNIVTGLFGDTIAGNSLKLQNAIENYTLYSKQLNEIQPIYERNKKLLEEETEAMEDLRLAINFIEEAISGETTKRLKNLTLSNIEQELAKKGIKLAEQGTKLDSILNAQRSKNIRQALANLKEIAEWEDKNLSIIQQKFNLQQQRHEKLLSILAREREVITNTTLAIIRYGMEYELANLKAEKTYEILGDRLDYINSQIQNQRKIISDYIDTWLKLEEAKEILKELELKPTITLEERDIITQLKEQRDKLQEQLDRLEPLKIGAEIWIKELELQEVEERVNIKKVMSEIDQMFEESNLKRLQIQKQTLDNIVMLYKEHYAKLKIEGDEDADRRLQKLVEFAKNFGKIIDEKIHNEEIALLEQARDIDKILSNNYANRLQAESKFLDEKLTRLKEFYTREASEHGKALSQKEANELRYLQDLKDNVDRQIAIINDMTSAWKNFFLTIMMGEKKASEALDDLWKTIRRQILEQQLETTFEPILTFLGELTGGLITPRFKTPIGRDVFKALEEGGKEVYMWIRKAFREETEPADELHGQTKWDILFGGKKEKVEQTGKVLGKIFGSSFEKEFQNFANNIPVILQNVITAGGITQAFGKIIPEWTQILTGILSMIPAIAPFAGILGGLLGAWFGEDIPKVEDKAEELGEKIDSNTEALKQLDLTLNEIMENIINAPPQFVYPILRGVQVPSLQGGGFIEKSGIAVVHRGEYVGQAPNININISGTEDSKAVARTVIREIEKYYPKSRSRIGTYVGIQ